MKLAFHICFVVSIATVFFYTVPVHGVKYTLIHNIATKKLRSSPSIATCHQINKQIIKLYTYVLLSTFSLQFCDIYVLFDSQPIRT